MSSGYCVDVTAESLLWRHSRHYAPLQGELRELVEGERVCKMLGKKGRAVAHAC